MKLLGLQERAGTTAASPAKAEMTIKGGLPTPSLAPLRDEPGERRDGFRADMVLDALGVAARGVGVDAQRQQEGFDHLVAFAAGLGEGLAFRGEERAAVRSEERRVGKACGSTCRSRWS